MKIHACIHFQIKFVQENYTFPFCRSDIGSNVFRCLWKILYKTFKNNKVLNFQKKKTLNQYGFELTQGDMQKLAEFLLMSHFKGMTNKAACRTKNLRKVFKVCENWNPSKQISSF